MVLPHGCIFQPAGSVRTPGQHPDQLRQDLCGGWGGRGVQALVLLKLPKGLDLQPRAPQRCAPTPLG